MGGGKGGKQETTSKVEIDPRLADAAVDQIKKAEHISKFGYQPNRNVQVAAFTPMQEAAFANQNAAMNAWGMQAPSDPMAGMPQATMSGSGIAGYSFAPEFDKAVSMLPEGYRQNIDNMFYDPVTGKPVSGATYGTEGQQAPAQTPQSNGKGGLLLQLANNDQFPVTSRGK